ncbi:kinesin [Cryptococcus deuterogattii 99/473]|uniref:Kinesin n=1 Tax=Cryptococcus deuterogattii Ram5 TaxID=1296110 RepID=A0A0D0V790_9TREE|nr:kinesin [Cryptococcus deuterogattii Ram5]KIY59843.1 kinesin [Cryptococcus deuterogattii 99/473]
MSGGNIKVVVRCRPLNARDKSYWSAGPKDDPKYASQQTLYEDLGADLLNHSFEGFNTCIFASKNIVKMGKQEDGAEKGIIPLTTSELFRRIEARMGSDLNLSYTVEVSYIEIYNEKVRDLLNPKNKGNLRVREHPSLGPYVEDLSRLVVENYTQMMTLMDEGNKARTVASTNMNETSSRSHAVFTLILTQKRHDPQTKMTGEKVSKISLVDLAGSERQASTGATGTRLKEGANINKSLTTLGKVIAALAQAGQNKRKKEEHVPYRDSVLTWLLKESLGGNSKTAMIAAISTLRYADAAKKIKTHAVVNEDPNAKLIRELKEELELLRSRVSSGLSDESSYDPSIPPEKQIVTYITKEGEIRKVTKLELQDQLEASEKLMESLNLTWEEKLQKTQAIHIEREKALEELGISIDTNCLIYQIKPGTTIAGAVDEDKAHIKLSGTHILPEHCAFTNDEGVVTIEAMPDARTFVNGKRVPPNSPVKLLNGFRVILGDSHVFRFNDPAAVRAERKRLRMSSSSDGLAGIAPGLRPDSPSSKVDTELMDWTAARREVADIEKLGDQDLDKLYDDILKVRTQRRRPESRMDIADLESHFERSTNPLSTPWAGRGQATTMTSNSLATPVGPDIDVNIVDEQSETSAEQASYINSALSTPSYDQKAADATLHQEHLTKQLKMMAQEVKRIRSQAAWAKAMEPGEMEPANWNVEQVRKLRRVVEKWKRLRSYKIAEELLLGAVDIREANVIAKNMEKQVIYNFLVVNGAIASPTSSLDGQNGIVEFEDVSGSITQHINGPVVVVKVIDWRAKSVYTWDLLRFRKQLMKMRHIYALKEKPNYSVHFEVDSPFTDVPPPSYSFIGSAKIPLRLLGKQLSYAVTVPIMCQYTMEAVGSCRVTFKVEPLDDVLGRSTRISSHRLPNGSISPGGRLTFIFIVDSVKGLSSTDYASIHAQTRLSSLIGPSIVSEDTFASQSVDLDKSSGTHLILKKAISVVVTPEIIQYMTNEYAIVEFFAKAKNEYLERLERWDVIHEVHPIVSSSTPGTPTKSGDSKPLMRRCETEFVAPERHDILAVISILELSSNGEYVPAQVYDDIFQLCQGLQRRLHIKLVHSSGKALPWEKMEHISTGDIRLVDKDGSASVGKPLVELKMSDQVVAYHPDGTSSLDAEGVWDTASHACRHLDRRTLPGQHLLIRLTWLVSVPTLSEPVIFHVDLPVKILGRGAKRSSFLTFWRGDVG